MSPRRIEGMALNIAFYKADHGGWFDRLIDLSTGNGGYSRVEIVFSDGVAFSASWMDGGCRFKRIDFNQERWKVIPSHILDEDEQIIRAFCEAQIGNKYDVFGALGLVLPTFHHERRKWFCSEVLITAFQQVNIMTGLKANNYSPNKWFKLAERPGLWIHHRW